MADRFAGNIQLGGNVSREQFVALTGLLDPLLDYDLEDGQGEFSESTSSDFVDLVQYCEEQKIPLLIQWDGKYEYGAQCEYWVDGKYHQFDTDTSGSIVVRVEDLDAKSTMSIPEFIASLEIPEFPDFVVLDESEV